MQVEQQRKKSKLWRRVAAALALTGLFLAAWAFWIEPSRLVVKHVTLELPQAPAVQLRIALLSDLHVGSPHMTIKRLRSIVQTVNRESPDVVLFAGDFVVTGVSGGPYVPPEPIAAELKSLRARLGVFAVLGNHDWPRGPEHMKQVLQSAGVMVLINDAAKIEDGADSLWIAGVADLWSGLADVDAALSKVTNGAPVFLLMHNPDLFPKVPPRISLTLAGHTHGGQVRLPLIGAPIVPSQFVQRYASGLIVEDGRRMFVTTGIGTSILPVRFGVPPEIVILTLRKSGKQ